MIAGPSPLLRRWALDPSVALVAATAAIGVAAVTLLPVALAFYAAVAVVGTVVVYRLPVLSLAALVMAGVGPLIFAQTERLPADALMLFGRVSPADVVLVAMLLCVGVRAGAVLLGTRTGSVPAVPSALAVAYTALFAWIALSIVRNLGVYGINAPGQFRYSYLILVAPAYALLFLNTPRQRRRFFAFLLAFSVAAPLAALPVIGAAKGWGIGPSTRFFPAPVSLGMLYGLVALIVASERRTIALPKWIGRVLVFPVGAVVIADSHRSVWLSALVLLVSLLVLSRITAGLWARVAWLTAAAGCLLLTVSHLMRLDIVSYVSSRGSALIDPRGDSTASWRLSVWGLNLERWRRNPLAGDGFGGYYTANAGLNVPTNIQPHNYYVQTLVTMGAVGVVLLLATVVAAAFTLFRGMRDLSDVGETLDLDLAEFGLSVLLSALAFCIAYPPSYYPVIWVGLALAAATACRQHGLSAFREEGV